MKREQYDQFYALVNQIVNLNVPQWQDKRRLLLNAAETKDDEDNLLELISWFQ